MENSESDFRAFSFQVEQAATLPSGLVAIADGHINRGMVASLKSNLSAFDAALCSTSNALRERWETPLALLHAKRKLLPSIEDCMAASWHELAIELAQRHWQQLHDRFEPDNPPSWFEFSDIDKQQKDWKRRHQGGIVRIFFTPAWDKNKLIPQLRRERAVMLERLAAEMRCDGGGKAAYTEPSKSTDAAGDCPDKNKKVSTPKRKLSDDGKACIAYMNREWKKNPKLSQKTLIARFCNDVPSSPDSLEQQIRAHRHLLKRPDKCPDKAN